MFGVGIFVTFAQRYKLSGTTGIARGLPLKLSRTKLAQFFNYASFVYYLFSNFLFISTIPPDITINPTTADIIYIVV